MAQDYVPPDTPSTGPVTVPSTGPVNDDRSFLPGTGARLVGGLALLAPAVVAWWISYVAPSFWTVRTSFYDVAPMRSGDAGEFVGLSNYSVVPDALRDFGRASGLAWLPLATIVIGAMLLAYAAHRSGRVGRWITRIAVALPMACFAPVAVAAGWRLTHAMESDAIGSPDRALGFLGAGVWLTTFGLVIGLGVTLYLSAMRRREAGRAISGALVTAVAIAALGTIAVALQLIAFPFLVTAGGPGGATRTPMFDIIESGFQLMQYGTSSVHSTLLLATLMALGVVTTIIVLVTRLRVELDPAARSADDPDAPAAVRWGAMIVTGVGLIAVLAVSGYGLWPWLSRLGGDGPAPEQSLLADTWLPPLLSALVGVLIAAIGGFAIGAMRPLGRWSELLLLPFAPWLFVGFGPFLIAHFERVREADNLNTFGSLIPPSWLVIPALFVFTVLFRGLESRRRREPGGANAVISRLLVPALPMVALAIGVVWVVRAQSMLWPYVADFEGKTAPMWVARQLFSLGVQADGFSLGIVFPVAGLVLAVVALIAAQVFYLDRLAIRVGDPDANDQR